MKRIKLTQGKYALIDDDDYELISKYKWHAVKQPRKNFVIYYANSGIVGRMHNFLMRPQSSKILVDHIDHNGLNNQRSNLRLCTESQNIINSRIAIKHSSKYRGVSWSNFSQRWLANIICQRVRYHLGSFKNEIDAARVYDRKAKKLHGKFAMLNFPDD